MTTFFKRFRVPHVFTLLTLMVFLASLATWYAMVVLYLFLLWVTLVAVLRLAVPYTGLILTAREPAELRREVLGFGVSQIDAGTRIELGGYTEAGDAQQQVREREQFELGDVRSLDAVIRQLLTDGYIPSFCTACYRLGRTAAAASMTASPIQPRT